jgi:hypothetical protein
MISCMISCSARFQMDRSNLKLSTGSRWVNPGPTQAGRLNMNLTRKAGIQALPVIEIESGNTVVQNRE